MVEVERIELSSKRLPRKALQLVETITPPKGREVPLARLPSSLPVPVGYTLSFTSDTTLPSNGIRQSRRWGETEAPPRHHLACALRCLVGCGSPHMPIGEILRRQQATKALVSLQRIVRLVRALLPEVSEQLANLN